MDLGSPADTRGDESLLRDTRCRPILAARLASGDPVGAHLTRDGSADIWPPPPPLRRPRHAPSGPVDTPLISIAPDGEAPLAPPPHPYPSFSPWVIQYGPLVNTGNEAGSPRVAQNRIDSILAIRPVVKPDQKIEAYLDSLATYPGVTARAISIRSVDVRR